MGWGGTIGVVLLTTVAGGCAAIGLASFLVFWLKISNFEGGAGYFTLFVTLTGIVSGFLVGLVTALAMHSGFWRVQGTALGIVAGLTVAAAVLVMVLDDNGPKIDGDNISLEVELKFPGGWKPDNYSRSEQGSFCWLQEKPIDAAQELNAMVLGGLTLTVAPGSDGRWVVPCSVRLTKSRKDRYMRIFVGHKTDVTIQIPLPARPGRKYTEWSEWSSTGFLPQKGRPAAVDYQYRCRVQTDKDHPSATKAFEDAREQALAAMPADAPLVQWLPFYENQKGQAIGHTSSDYREVAAVQARPAELAPLLRSNDRTVVRRAVFATAALDKVPEVVIEPLAAAGRYTIDLIQEARAGALPDDPDLVAEGRAYNYFVCWQSAMERAGAAGNRSRRAVLEEISHEVRGSTGTSGLHWIDEEARKQLTELGPAVK